MACKITMIKLAFLVVVLIACIDFGVFSTRSFLKRSDSYRGFLKRSPSLRGFLKRSDDVKVESGDAAKPETGAAPQPEVVNEAQPQEQKRFDLDNYYGYNDASPYASPYGYMAHKRFDFDNFYGYGPQKRFDLGYAPRYTAFL